MIETEIREKIKRSETEGYNPLLVIFIGESGVGKSTFCEAMNCKDKWYGSSQAMEKALELEGKPINHDTIHAYAQEAYARNPLWQVPLILEAMDEKDFLLLDGPRRFKEVEALKTQYPRTLIVRITASEADRFKRLNQRDGVTEEEFRRILDDEAKQTDLMGIMTLTDVVLNNTGTLEQIQAEAVRFAEIIKEYAI